MWVYLAGCGEIEDVTSGELCATVSYFLDDYFVQGF